AASRRARVPLPEAAGPSTAITTLEPAALIVPSCLGQAGPKAVHQGHETGKARVDGGTVVDGDGTLCRHAEHEEGHGDAMIEIGHDLRSAGGVLAAAAHGQAVLALSDLYAAGGQPAPPPPPSGPFPGAPFCQ